MTAPRSEYRRDRLTGAWTLISPARRGLPKGASVDPLLPEPPGVCPFCPGNEKLTELTIARWPVEGEWLIRSVANKYPMVDPETPDAFAALDSTDAFEEEIAGLKVENALHP